MRRTERRARRRRGRVQLASRHIDCGSKRSETVFCARGIADWPIVIIQPSVLHESSPIQRKRHYLRMLERVGRASLSMIAVPSLI